VRYRLAALVALLYCAGVVMPSAALAFGNGAASEYCFDEIAGEVAALGLHVHVHADGTVHHHSLDHASSAADHGDHGKSHNPKNTPHSHDANCCGAYGFAAVLPVLDRTIERRTETSVEPPILTECLGGCDPHRIDRPPIFLLSM
jgi:hypothetical protein